MNLLGIFKCLKLCLISIKNVKMVFLHLQYTSIVTNSQGTGEHGSLYPKFVITEVECVPFVKVLV